MDAQALVRILDLVGTFVFAISGAVAAVNRRLDLFGILVLSFVAGNFGGITRDVLIGAAPPAALADGYYLLVSLLAGLVTFFWYKGVDRLRSPMLLFDAAGLSLFAVAGAQKALGRSGPVLRPALHGDPLRLASADGRAVRATAREFLRVGRRAARVSVVI